MTACYRLYYAKKKKSKILGNPVIRISKYSIAKYSRYKKTCFFPEWKQLLPFHFCRIHDLGQKIQTLRDRVFKCIEKHWFVCFLAPSMLEFHKVHLRVVYVFLLQNDRYKNYSQETTAYRIPHISSTVIFPFLSSPSIHRQIYKWRRIVHILCSEKKNRGPEGETRYPMNMTTLAFFSNKMWYTGGTK